MMVQASWCYFDRPPPPTSSIYYYDDHCYTTTMSLQPDTRPSGDSGAVQMTVDVDMDDAGGIEKLQNVSTTSCNNVPQASTITTTSTIASGSAEVTVSADPYKDSIQELKKSLTLDLSSPESAKKSLATPELLSFLRFTSPDLEKFFLTQQFSNTPNGLVGGGNTPTPTSYFYPKNVTSEQEQYARGFIDALNQLHLLRGPCIPMTSLLSPGFVTTTIQQADKDELNKYRESTAVSVEQLFRTLTAGAVWSPGSFPSTTSVGTSTAGPSLVNPTTISIPVQSSVIFPPLPNKLSVITTSNGSGINNLVAAAAVAAAAANNTTTNLKVEPSAQTNSHSPSPCVSPNSASCSSVHSDQVYTPPPTQVLPIHSSSVNYAQPLVPPAVSFGNLVVPGSMLPTAQFITLPSSTSHHNPRTNSTANVHHQLNSSHLGVHVVKVEDSSSSKHSSQFTTRSTNNNNNNNNNNNSQNNLPAGISVSPMDPKSQERMKLERKRARNRVAATKCRRRKIEKITNLDDKVKEITKQNDEIEDKINSCKQDVARLRQLVKEHQLRGCNLQII